MTHALVQPVLIPLVISWLEAAELETETMRAMIAYPTVQAIDNREIYPMHEA